MPITRYDYMPVLKWRQGEYQALMRLADAIKDRTVPLIEVTPPDFDFETQTPVKTIDEHLIKFGSRLHAKWGARLALLDMSLLPPATRMLGGKHPLLYAAEQSIALGATVIPVIRLHSDMPFRDAVYAVDAITENGAALRCSLDEAIDPDFDDHVADLLEAIDISPGDLDIVLDLESPNWDPQDGLIALITAAISGGTTFAAARSITLVASSFPDSMGAVTGPIQYWPRREWALYRALLASLGPAERKPGFGDYAIASPGYAQLDMRLLKPSATIRYTCNDGWIIAKGSNVRDNGFGQYRHCSGSVLASTHYLGAGYSPGSAYINGCHGGVEKTGNLTTWRWVGTNHHITKVVNDLATLSGS